MTLVAKTALVVCLCIGAAFLAMYAYPLIGHGVWLVPLALIARLARNGTMKEG